MVTKCPRCLRAFESDIYFEPFFSGHFPSKHLKKPIAIIVLHGLHACGVARRCLQNCRILTDSGHFVVVVATRGGGIWTDRFMADSDLIFFLRSEKEIMPKNLESLFQRSVYVEVHYQPSICWILEKNCVENKLNIYFHTEIIGLFEDGEIINRCCISSKKIYFPTETLLQSYRQLVDTSNLPEFDQKANISPNNIVKTVNLDLGDPHSLNDFGVMPKRLAIVTRLDEDKTSSHVLIQTLTKVLIADPEFRVVIAGTGEKFDSMIEDLITFIKQGKIRILGYVDDVDSIYRWCSVFFLPSWTEVLPFTVLEAAIWGKTAIIPDLQNLQDGFSDLIPTPVYYKVNDSQSAFECILNHTIRSTFEYPNLLKTTPTTKL